MSTNFHEKKAHVRLSCCLKKKKRFMFIPTILLFSVYLCKFVAYFKKLNFYIFLTSAIRIKN
jgi:hypothetical protein